MAQRAEMVAARQAGALAKNDPAGKVRCIKKAS